jgi:hypothetical protein
MQRDASPSVLETAAPASSGARIAPHGDAPIVRVRAGHFKILESSYRRSGGIAHGEDVVRMLRQCCAQPLSRLARWIVCRDVVSFEHHGATWLPLFQFEQASMSLRPEVASVIGELVDVFDDWELAEWFTLPNAWLRGVRPVDALAVYPSAVGQAARADRFVARG